MVPVTVLFNKLGVSVPLPTDTVKSRDTGPTDQAEQDNPTTRKRARF